MMKGDLVKFTRTFWASDMRNIRVVLGDEGKKTADGVENPCPMGVFATIGKP